MELTQIPDHELTASFRNLVIDEREKLSLQLEYIAELDRRKLFYHYSSLRSFLVEEYGMEVWNAERRIRAARMLKRFPETKGMLESGKLNLTLIELALGCASREKLSDPELRELLQAISGTTCRSAKRELAARFPNTLLTPHDQIIPLTADLSEVRFVANHETLEKIEEIRGLLVHSYPRGLTMGALIDLLATEYCERHHPEEKAKRAKVRKEKRETLKKKTEPVETPTAPRVPSETHQTHDPEHTRTANRSLSHELTTRDGYKCTNFDEVTKKRCLSKAALQMDHNHPWSKGGNTELSNLRYLCISHHQRVSFLQFGESLQYFRSKQE